MTEGDSASRAAVMTGRVAFLEPLISTVPLRLLPPLTEIFCIVDSFCCHCEPMRQLAWLSAWQSQVVKPERHNLGFPRRKPSLSAPLLGMTPKTKKPPFGGF